MKPATILCVFSLLLFANVCKADLATANTQNTQALTIQKLQQFRTNNYFAYGNASDSTLQEHILKNHINQSIESTRQAFIHLYQSNSQPSKQQLLHILSNGINQIDPNSLYTDDREQVATIFENFLDVIDLESSDGILNTWVYGKEITDLITKPRAQ
jgi:serine protease inhibitor